MDPEDRKSGALCGFPWGRRQLPVGRRTFRLMIIRRNSSRLESSEDQMSPKKCVRTQKNLRLAGTVYIAN